MNLKRTFLVGGLMVALIVAIPVSQVLGAEPPGASGIAEKIIGPTMWGVCVINSDYSATLRVKKIDDCNVDTDPQVGTVTALPTSESDVLYWRLAPGSVFGLDGQCEPIITKVKNFKVDGDLISFDAQIQFVVPDSYGDVCE